MEISKCSYVMKRFCLCILSWSINALFNYPEGGGMNGPLLKTLTFFWPKSAIFPAPFMTWPKMRAFNDGLIDNDEKKAFLIYIPNSRREWLTPYPIYHQNGQTRYPVYDENGWKTIPFGAAETLLADKQFCPFTTSRSSTEVIPSSKHDMWKSLPQKNLSANLTFSLVQQRVQLIPWACKTCYLFTCNLTVT